MKPFLLTNFRDNLQFTPAHGIHGNAIIVHSVEVNPVDYIMASITAVGSGDKEITLAFAKMINHKLKSQELLQNFPLSAKNLMKELDKCDLIKEIFYAISLSCKPTVPINDFGYASPKSPNKANKIWSIIHCSLLIFVSIESYFSQILFHVVFLETFFWHSHPILHLSAGALTLLLRHFRSNLLFCR